MPDDVLAATGLTPCDVKALKECLDRTGGDRAKCAAEIAAFQRACGGATGLTAAAPPPQAGRAETTATCTTDT